MFFLDLNTIEQLDQVAETIRKSPAPKIIVDHHYAQPMKQPKSAGSASSTRKQLPTAKSVYRLFKQAKAKPDQSEAKALFIGIAFDTRHFALASASTFGIVARLVGTGIDVQATLQEFALPIDTSERLAKLKACKRARIERVERLDNRCSPTSASSASGKISG